MLQGKLPFFLCVCRQLNLNMASFLVLIEGTEMIMLVSLSCSKCLYQLTCKNSYWKHVLRCGFGVGGSVFAYYLPGMVVMVAPDRAEGDW
jgi:hypothetical protein